MELTDSLKALFMETARSLKGSARRLFMARTVKELRPGGQRHAEALLDSIEAVLAFTRTMTWNGVHPVVELVTTTYQTGVKLSKEAMDRVEAQLQRLPHLEK